MDLGKILPLVVGVLALLNFIWGFLPFYSGGGDSISIYGGGAGYLPLAFLIAGLLAIGPLLPKGQKASFAVAVISVVALLGALFALVMNSVGASKGIGIILLLIFGIFQAAAAVLLWLFDAGVIKASANGSMQLSTQAFGAQTGQGGYGPGGPQGGPGPFGPGAQGGSSQFGQPGQTGGFQAPSFGQQGPQSGPGSYGQAAAGGGYGATAGQGSGYPEAPAGESIGSDADSEDVGATTIVPSSSIPTGGGSYAPPESPSYGGSSTADDADSSPSAGSTESSPVTGSGLPNLSKPGDGHTPDDNPDDNPDVTQQVRF
ncbi:MAG: DUF5336 domain-containing protein [Nakamurella sp.]